MFFFSLFTVLYVLRIEIIKMLRFLNNMKSRYDFHLSYNGSLDFLVETRNRFLNFACLRTTKVS